jgi:3-dehydroquinate dehydratase-2
MKILLINGPNLGRLGKRQPEIYGSTTLAEVEAAAAEHAAGLGHSLVAYQSNHEGAIIDRIEVRDFDAIVINAGAGHHRGRRASQRRRRVRARRGRRPRVDAR